MSIIYKNHCLVLESLSHIPPEHHKDAFTCPHCLVFAHQEWYGRLGGQKIHFSDNGQIYFPGIPISMPINTLDGEELDAAICVRCGNYTLWRNKEPIHPRMRSSPPPHSDLPDKLKETYDRASDVAEISSPAAAAMLRLLIETFTNDLLEDEKGRTLSENIDKLVKKGLSPDTKTSFEAVRIIGNNAVHSGKIIVNDEDGIDDKQVVRQLFGLINLIVADVITRPKMIADVSKLAQDLQNDKPYGGPKSGAP